MSVEYAGEESQFTVDPRMLREDEEEADGEEDALFQKYKTQRVPAPLSVGRVADGARGGGRHLSLMKLTSVNMFGFSYGMIITTMGLVVLPKEVTVLWHSKHSLILAGLLALCGLSQLIAPIVGYFSDRCKSSFGRRRPFIVGGTAGLSISLGMMYWARIERLQSVYVLFFFIAMVTITIAFASFCGLALDVVHGSSQIGEMSGVQSALVLSGSVVGLSLFSSFLEVKESYFLFIACAIASAFITCVASDDAPLVHSTLPRVSWSKIASLYYLSPNEHGDFFWVCLSRTFFYMALCANVFTLFYLRDVIKLSDDDTKLEESTARVALVGQAASAVLVYPAGVYSDKRGRKHVVYLACVLMSAAYIGYLFARSLGAVFGLAVLFGLGDGAFLSVDYALACDTLPDPENAARLLGLWGITLFVGTLAGSLSGGMMLHFFGHEDPQTHHYSLDGYIGLLGSAAVYMYIAAFIVKRLKTVR